MSKFRVVHNWTGPPRKAASTSLLKAKPHDSKDVSTITEVRLGNSLPPPHTRHTEQETFTGKTTSLKSNASRPLTPGFTALIYFLRKKKNLQILVL